MEYNLDELETSGALSTATHQPTAAGPQNNRRPNPVRRGSSTPNVPATRRGSLVPSADLGLPSPPAGRRRRQSRLHELNLFHFDLRELVRDVLLTEGESLTSYHEYAVFSAPDGLDEPHSPSIMSNGEDGLRMFHDAINKGHGLDDEPPYDFLSMKYELRNRTTTALIRRSFDTRWHDEFSLDEYERRLDASRDRWAHPLVLPTVLLQVQLLRTEEAVVANNGEVLELEGRVDDLTGSPRRTAAEAARRMSSKSENQPLSPLKRLSTFREKVGRNHEERREPESPPFAKELDDDYVPPQTIHLMKEAHDVLKGAIQLLDTLRWMERAVKLLIQAGDELDVRMSDMRQQNANKPGSAVQDDDDNELPYHWHEIRQYLDCTWRLCTSLETDRRMSELRCRAQIDIIYSKMAQEDNNLNARMAVASTRDSSSMKALAVITAIFLPGEFISSLFGISMFDWEWGTASDSALGDDAPADDYPHPVIMPLFWVYWAFTLPLTIFIVVLWRAWWVNQDRFFRRHLSMELSNERYWTTDGKPRDLETSFTQDFFSLFRRSGAGSSANSSVLGTTRRRTMSIDSQNPALQQQQQQQHKRGNSLSASTTIGKDGDFLPQDMATRMRTISFARQPRTLSPSRAV
ncbi:hypothetical protein LQW54_008454 [Pestalotiopsis sp. IQ-011]